MTELHALGLDIPKTFASVLEVSDAAESTTSDLFANYRAVMPLKSY